MCKGWCLPVQPPNADWAVQDFSFFNFGLMWANHRHAHVQRLVLTSPTPNADWAVQDLCFFLFLILDSFGQTTDMPMCKGWCSPAQPPMLTGLCRIYAFSFFNLGLIWANHRHAHV